jgi:mono/diheme cytochrome c family protein
VLAFVVAAGAGFATLLGVGCAIGANACPFSKGERIATTDGRQLYAASCAACHGLDGEGARGPSLVSGSAAALVLGELVSQIERGRPLAGMPRFRGALSPEQIDAVARHVLSLRGER